MDKYDTGFYSVIHSLLELSYNKNQIDLIYFYLYDRITPEGYMKIFTDDTGRELDLSTPESLYNEVNRLK